MRFLLLLLIVAGACERDPVMYNPYTRTTPGEDIDRRSDAGVPPEEGCGNGVVEAGEACDDGNRNNDDGCTSSCELSEAPVTLRAVPVVDAVAGSRRFERRGDGTAVIAPFQAVRLSGRASTASTGEVVAYEWSVDPANGGSVPAGSQVGFDDASKDRPRLVHSVHGERRPGVDVNGHYRVALRVQDESGRWSPWARTGLFAKPNRALWVELTWDVDAHDIDTHLIRGGDPDRAYTTEQDCYYGNCVPTFAGVPVLEWGSASPGDDPFLDVDDVDGIGPEVTSVLSPERGMVYTVALHMFRFDRGREVPTANIKVFVDGELVEEVSREMPDDEDWWVALNIVWLDEAEIEIIDRLNDRPPNP